MHRLILLVLAFNNVLKIEATDRVSFIKSFIENERKPTNLVFNMCWSKRTQLKLIKEMASIGVRTSVAMETATYLDQSLLYTADLSCHDVERILLNASSKHLLRAPYRWLVFSNSSNPIPILEELPLFPDSDLVLAEQTYEGYKMTELHKPSVEGAMISTLRGFYNGTLLDVRPHRSLFRRRKDVMGHPLTMANVIQDSNSTQYHLPKEDRLEPQYDSIAKLSWSNVKLGFLMLNATPRYMFSHRWGYYVNGNWSGMIDDINSNRAVVGTNCLVKADRLPVVVFTDNLAPFRVRFVYRQPPLSYVSNIFSLPFSTGVWTAMLVCAAAATIAIYLATYWEATIEKSPSQLDGSIGDALLLTMSAVSQQGCVMEPKKASGRIMVWFLFAALMELYAAYSANIVVLLQAPSNTIKSLAQLAHSKITLAANDVDYNHFVFKLFPEDPTRFEIFKKVDPVKGKKQFYEINDGIERIREGLFAFHSIVEPLYRGIENTFLESEKCDLMEVDFLNDFDPSTPVKKDSPYLELLRVVFKQIRESGIREALAGRLLTAKPKCAEKGAAFSSVGLLDLQPVLILMLYGVALSTIIALLEMIVYRISQRYKNRKINSTSAITSLVSYDD